MNLQTWHLHVARILINQKSETNLANCFSFWVMAAGYISRAPPNATYNNHVIEHRAGHERHQKKYQTSTATVVEAPPAKADLRSILQNGTDGDAATFEGGLKGLIG